MVKFLLCASSYEQGQDITALESKIPEIQIVTFNTTTLGRTSPPCPYPTVSASCPENYTATACSCDTDYVAADYALVSGRDD